MQFSGLVWHSAALDFSRAAEVNPLCYSMQFAVPSVDLAAIGAWVWAVIAMEQIHEAGR
jgi:hypothetical protein